MERKIGEIFEYKGEWYQCVKSPDGSCKHCDMNFGGKCPIPIKECVASSRSDLSYVIFKKLEKVGEPFELLIDTNKKVLMQEYKIYGDMYIWENKSVLHTDCFNGIRIEIKQNKEDMGHTRCSDLVMEENELKTKQIIDKLVDDYVACRITYDKFSKAMKSFYADGDESKPTLKEFDLEAAKAGKPVCTRDGRKARIICFDRINGDYYKIVACVTAFDGNFEEVLFYGIDGYRVDSQNPKDEDLMMLPEKKGGWINICRNLNTNKTELDTKDIYNTKEEALQNLSSMTYVTTVKIEWEE